jgi:hypothetical protein
MRDKRDSQKNRFIETLSVQVTGFPLSTSCWNLSRDRLSAQWPLRQGDTKTRARE